MAGRSLPSGCSTSPMNSGTSSLGSNPALSERPFQSPTAPRRNMPDKTRAFGKQEVFKQRVYYPHPRDLTLQSHQDHVSIQPKLQ